MTLEEDILADLVATDEKRRFFFGFIKLGKQPVDYVALATTAINQGYANHLGYALDVHLQRELISDQKTATKMQEARDILYHSRLQEDRSYYSDQDPRVAAIKKKKRTKLLEKWHLIAIIDEEKCEEVYTNERKHR
jgi:hypothetical protein